MDLTQLVSKSSRVLDLLRAFLSPPYRDWWLSYANEPERVPQHCSHWLVRKSAARAFASGFVKLERRQPSIEVSGGRESENPYRQCIF